VGGSRGTALMKKGRVPWWVGVGVGVGEALDGCSERLLCARLHSAAVLSLTNAQCSQFFTTTVQSEGTARQYRRGGGAGYGDGGGQVEIASESESERERERARERERERDDDDDGRGRAVGPFIPTADGPRTGRARITKRITVLWHCGPGVAPRLSVTFRPPSRARVRLFVPLACRYRPLTAQTRADTRRHAHRDRPPPAPRLHLSPRVRYVRGRDTGTYRNA
jgi:hypothetical protein